MVQLSQQQQQLDSFSKIFEKILKEQHSPFLDKTLSIFIAAYRTAYSPQYVFIKLVVEWKSKLYDFIVGSNLKGHSANIKCMQRFISFSRSKSRFCQPSEIVFLSSIALLKVRIWRKTFGPISVFITLLFLCFVVSQQRLQIFVIVRRLVVGEH